MKLLVIRVLPVAALLISLGTAVLGCSCGGGFGPACQEATGADAIFLGRVVEKNMTRSCTAVRVTFDLSENFRGVSGKSAEIITAAACCKFIIRVPKNPLAPARLTGKVPLSKLNLDESGSAEWVSGSGECRFVLQKSQTVLVAGCSRRLYPKTNGAVQLSG